ncbi:MAG: ribulose-phosphate 3-epimerase [Bacilli bacterium]|nr:ribulose-phosphate 3-epimerase [Bacilli bacterium]
MVVSTSFLKEGNYSDFIKELNNSNTDMIHYDVMDGKFVDNTNLKTLSELTKYVDLSTKKVDVHLMVEDPRKYIEGLSLYNINNITIHKEIKNYLEMLDLIKSYGIRVGIAINPDTPVEDIYDILDKVDVVLVMSVYPGKSGQTFIEESSYKIKKLREEITNRNLNTKIEVDGGVCEEVLPLISDVDIVVSASYILNDLNNINVIKNYYA